MNTIGGDEEFAYLMRKQLQSLYPCVMTLVHQYGTARNGLICGLPAWFLDLLPNQPHAAAQLQVDLEHLNKAEPPRDGEAAFAIFLGALLAMYEKVSPVAANTVRELLGVVKERTLLYHAFQNARDAQPQPGQHLVGRKALVQAISSLVVTDKVRLIVLVGGSGMGKTALARAISPPTQTFPSGQVTVRLPHRNSGHGQGPDILSLLAETLKIGSAALDVHGRNRALLDRLSGVRALIIVDNFERATNGEADVAQLLASTKNLKVLVTTRDTAGMTNESAINLLVGPLATPPADGISSPAELASCAAVQLFLERARALEPRFATSPEDLPIVGRLCSLLNGRPLSLELAASQARTQTPQQMLQELNDEDQSLRATLNPEAQVKPLTIKWRYDKMSLADQIFFRKLAVFSGGFTVDAAVEVGAIPASNSEYVRRVLEDLVGSRLVMPSPDVRGRYWMHERVLEFALGELTPQEREAAREAHARYYKDKTLAWHRDMRGQRRQAAIMQLSKDYENIRSALQWTRSNPSHCELGLKMAASLFWYWNFGGYFREGVETLEALLRLPDCSLRRSDNWARASAALGGLHFMRGEITAAKVALEAAVQILELSPDSQIDLAYALVILGRVTPDYDYGVRLEQRSAEIFKKANDNWGRALALNDLGYVAVANQEYQLAVRSYGKSIKLWRQLDDPWGLPLALSNLGFFYCFAQRRNPELVRKLLDEALSIQLRAADAWGSAETLKYLAELDRRASNLPRAERRFADSLRLHMKLGRAQLIVDCILGLARVAADNAWLNKDVTIASHAATLFAAGHSLRVRGAFPISKKELEMNHPLVGQVRTQILDQMSRSDLANLLRLGRSMTLEEACDAARSLLDRP